MTQLWDGVKMAAFEVPNLSLPFGVVTITGIVTTGNVSNISKLIEHIHTHHLFSPNHSHLTERLRETAIQHTPSSPT